MLWLCLDGLGKLMQQKNVCNAVAFADSSSTSESVIWGNSIKQANRMASTMVLLNLGQWHTQRATKPMRNQEGTHVKSEFSESKQLYHSFIVSSIYHSYKQTPWVLGKWWLLNIESNQFWKSKEPYYQFNYHIQFKFQVRLEYMP